MASEEKAVKLQPTPSALQAIAACRGAMRKFATSIEFVELAIVREPLKVVKKEGGPRMDDANIMKIEALTTTLADRLYLEGFELRRIDLRKLNKAQVEDEDRNWNMRVDVVGDEQGGTAP